MINKSYLIGGIYEADKNEPKLIGKILKKARNEADITQERMGKILGHKQNYISGIESGNSKLSAEHLIAYCRLLGISLDEVIYKREKHPIITKLKTLLEEFDDDEQEFVYEILVYLLKNKDRLKKHNDLE